MGKASLVILTCGTISLLMFLGNLKAQSFEADGIDSAARKSEIRIGIRYTNDYYYMGRSDSAAAPYLSPSIGYFHKSGLYARSSFSYLTTTEQERIDLILLSAGYDYYGKKVGVGASISEYIFNDLSYAVQAEMSTYLNAYFEYHLLGFMLYLDGSAGFSDGADLFVGGEISRPFYALGNKLKIIPGLYVNGGTQKYYNAFYANRSARTGAGSQNKKGHGGPQASHTEQLTIVESDAFELLDFETDLQVSYTVGKVRFFILTTWTFPRNPATVVSGDDVYEEHLDNGFFWSSGVRVAFH